MVFSFGAVGRFDCGVSGVHSARFSGPGGLVPIGKRGRTGRALEPLAFRLMEAPVAARAFSWIFPP